MKSFSVIFLSVLFMLTAISAEMQDRNFNRFPIDVPTGWYYKEVIKDSVKSCFISKESIEDDGKFTTGVSVYVLEDFKKSFKMNGGSYILLQCSKALSKENTAFDSFNSQLRGHGMAANYRYVDFSIPDERIKVFCVFMEDVKNDQVISVICESKEMDFDGMMKTVMPMLSKFEIR